MPLLNPPSTDVPGRHVCSHWELAGTREGNRYPYGRQCPSGLGSLSPSHCGLGEETTNTHLKLVKSEQYANERHICDMVSGVQKFVRLGVRRGYWPTGVALPRKMTVVTISNMATTALAWKSTQSAIQVKNKSQNKSQKARASHLAWALVTQRDGFPWIRREFRGLPPVPRLKHRSLFFFF